MILLLTNPNQAESAASHSNRIVAAGKDVKVRLAICKLLGDTK